VPVFVPVAVGDGVLVPVWVAARRSRRDECSRSVRSGTTRAEGSFTRDSHVDVGVTVGSAKTEEPARRAANTPARIIFLGAKVTRKCQNRKPAVLQTTASKKTLLTDLPASD
jgi:hypothetical protein